MPIPAHWRGQTVNLEIEPGYTEERDQSAPDTLARADQKLRKSGVSGEIRGDSASAPVTAGVSFKGRVAHDLPPGALDVIRPETSSIAPETFATTTRVVVDLPQFMVGRDRVSVTVRPVLR